MNEHTQNIYAETELDLALLATPFNIQTNWHVITGAPCSGKTTIVNMLTAKGFQTVPEPARQYFEEEFAKGRTIEDIRKDPAALTHQIYALTIQQYCEIDPDEIAFFDRGLPDTLTFFRLVGIDPNQSLPDCFLHQYASVFLLNRLPYQQDDVRAGSDEAAAYFESWVYRDYTAMGYDVVNVPVLPPEERLTYILDRLHQEDRP